MTTDRMEIDPADLGPFGTYPWLTSTIVPRPIAWVSTRSVGGIDNLAPHSFFTVASAEPPVVSFTSVGEKDTLRNVRATGEFVVALAPRRLAEIVNLTATDFPGHHSEFDQAGVEREVSLMVGPCRVADSPVALECRFVGEKTFGTSTVVFGEVVHLAVDRAVLGPDGLPEIDLLAPAARLGRNDWSAIGEVFALERIPFSELPPTPAV
ncbi:MAG: flavin reductase family protein [Acidimicrobiales bacterium]